MLDPKVYETNNQVDQDTFKLREGIAHTVEQKQGVTHLTRTT